MRTTEYYAKRRRLVEQAEYHFANVSSFVVLGTLFIFSVWITLDLLVTEAARRGVSIAGVL